MYLDRVMATGDRAVDLYLGGRRLLSLPFLHLPPLPVFCKNAGRTPVTRSLATTVEIA